MAVAGRRALGRPFSAPSPEALDRPDSPMNRLAAAAPQLDPLCCRSEWQLSFHEAFARSRPLHLRACEGSLIAFAEQLHPRLGALLEPLEAHWLFGCPLLGPDAPELLASLLDEDAFASRRPMVLLSGLLPGSALARALPRAFARRFEGLRLEPTVVRSASLEGGVDGFLSRRSAAFRRNLRRAERAAGERGVRFERCRPLAAGEADAAFERMARVERASWKGLEGRGMAEPPSSEFYGGMLRRLASAGAGRVAFARLDERDVGYVFGGVAGPYYRGQQFSYAEECRGLSLGNLLQLAQIRWLCEEGVQRYDMGSLMEYKRHWAELELKGEVLLLRPRP